MFGDDHQPPAKVGGKKTRGVMVVGEELDFGTLGAVTDELLQIFLTRLQPGLGGCTVWYGVFYN